jgi:hypothetical protein
MSWDEEPWFVKLVAYVSFEALFWIVVGVLVGFYALFK